MTHVNRFEEALLDPHAVYATPRGVVDDGALSREQKIEVLRRWEYDAAELEVAEEEGMRGGETSMLRQILLALEELGAELNTERSPPTKQDGV